MPASAVKIPCANRRPRRRRDESVTRGFSRLRLRHGSGVCEDVVMTSLLLALVLSAADATAVSPAEAAAGKALLEKAIDAAGGAKELATIQDVTFTGTVSASFDGIDAGGKVTIIETRDGSSRTQMDLGGFEMVSAIGPNGGFTSQAGMTKQLSGNDLVQAQAQSRFSPLGLLIHGFDPGVTLRARPKEDGFDVLEVRPPGADPLTFFLDPASHLVTRLKVVNVADGMTLVSDFSLYKAVDGVQLAHRVTLNQSSLELTLTFTQVQVNAGVAPGLLPRGASRTPATSTSPSEPLPSSTAAPASESVTISILNRTGKILGEVHFSPQGKKDWGANLLPMDRFHDGDTVKVPFGRGSACVFDLMVADADSQFSVMPGVDLCKSQALTLRTGKRGTLIVHEK